MTKFTLSLIIPAHNEEKKITKDIKAAFNYFNKNKIKVEVIVSCDGCQDNTENIVNDFQKIYKNLFLISSQTKSGKGGALKKGVKQASGKYIMFADAGLCVPYKYVKDGINALEKGADMAIASRAHRESVINRPQPFYRFVGSRAFGLVIRYFMHSPKEIPDTQCGFKIYQKDVAKQLFGKLETGGFMFDLELLLRAKKKGYKIAQFPVVWSNDADTKFNPIKHGHAILQQLWKIKFQMKL